MIPNVVSAGTSRRAPSRRGRSLWQERLLPAGRCAAVVISQTMTLQLGKRQWGRMERRTVKSLKRIAIDMDEVIADFSEKHLRLYNDQFGESLTAEDLRGHRLWTLRPQVADDILSMLDHPLFFRDLSVMPDSQEVIAELARDYEIFIATAAMERPTSFAAKYEWLKEHFPFLPDKNFVFCGDKSIIYADYLIDDSVRHFKRFVGQGILFTASHNIYEEGYVRVKDWQDVRRYFRETARGEEP